MAIERCRCPSSSPAPDPPDCRVRGVVVVADWNGLLLLLLLLEDEPPGACC